MERTAIVLQATQILAKIPRRDKSCDRKTYLKFLIKYFASDEITVAEIATLCQYYECPVDRLIEKIVWDRM